MRWRVNEKEYSLIEMNDDQRTGFYKYLYDKRPIIECLCNENNGHYPKIHIRHSKDKLFYYPQNNSSNSKKGIHHADECILNTLYRALLEKHGLKVLDDGTLICTIKDIKKKSKVKVSESIKGSKDPETKSQPKPKGQSQIGASLRTLFFALLQRYDVHCFRVKQKRNVEKRLYKATIETEVNKESLQDIGYLTHSKFRYKYKKHKLIIGWGNKNEITQNGDKRFWKIPLYCIDEPNKMAITYSLPKWVYEKATFTRANVDTGYFVIWRKIKPNGVLADDQMIFVPAEEHTMIPVDSSHERIMLQHLVNQSVNFKKPLLLPGEESYKPDFILDEKRPNTIIEVAGLMNDPGYVKHLREKEEFYKEQGYEYVEWDVNIPLNIIFK